MPNVSTRDESAAGRAALGERGALSCVACGELIAEVLETRPEYCFVCAVHVACACADESETR